MRLRPLVLLLVALVAGCLDDAAPAAGAPGSSGPLRFVLGPDAQGGYASARLVEDGFVVDVVGVGDATLRAEALLLVTNAAGAPAELRLAAPRWDDPRILAARLLLERDAVDLLAPGAEGAWTLLPGESRALGVEVTTAGVPRADTLGSRPVHIQVLDAEVRKG